MRLAAEVEAEEEEAEVVVEEGVDEEEAEEEEIHSVYRCCVVLYESLVYVWADQ